MMLRNKLAAWALGIALFFTSCTDTSRYVEALPSDAAMVTAVDLRGLADKAGLTDADPSAVQAVWKRLLGDELEGAGSLLQRLTEEPRSCGLDLADRAYVFMAPEAEYWGILFRMHDRSELENLMTLLHNQHWCETIRESDGSSWTVMGNYLAAWSDTAFLLLSSPRQEVQTMQRQADRWLRQEAGESFVSQPDYARLSNAGGEIASVVSLNVLPLQYVLPFTMGVSGDLKLKDIRAVASLHCHPGKAVLEVETLVDDTVAREWVDRQLQATAPLSGTYLDFFPQNYGSWLSFHADGASLYRLCTAHPGIRRQLEHSMIPIDFESVFNAIRGDVVLAMPDGFQGRRFIACAQVTDTGFLQTLEDLKPMLSMTGGQARLTDVGMNAYEFRTTDASLVGLPEGPLSLWMGVKDGHAYLTNDRRLLEDKVLGLSLHNTSWGQRTAGQRLMAAWRMDNVLQGGEYLTLESADGTHFRMEYTMKDKQTDILRQWAGQFGLW